MPNRYDRITGPELKAEIRQLGLTFGQFAQLYGTQRTRVLAWINGRQDIPHTVNAFCALLALPNGVDRALAIANDYLVENEPPETEEEPAMPDTS